MNEVGQAKSPRHVLGWPLTLGSSPNAGQLIS